MKTTFLALFLTLFAVPSLTSAHAADRGTFFSAADADYDDVLNEEEFRDFIDLLAKSGQSNAKYVKFFRLYNVALVSVDANKDGLASREELENAKQNHLQSDSASSAKPLKPLS